MNSKHRVIKWLYIEIGILHKYFSISEMPLNTLCFLVVNEILKIKFQKKNVDTYI